jgi:hypothetical protein
MTTPDPVNRAAMASSLAANCPVTGLVLDRIGEGEKMHTSPTGLQLLLKRASARGAFPIVYQHLKDLDVPLPADIKSRWLKHVARLSLYRRELARVVGVLETLGPVVVLKGEPLSTLLYGDGLLRNTTDMDLLIDPRRVDEACAAVGELGYRAVRAEEAKTWAYNQLALVHENYGTIIELHWRVAFPHLPSPPIDRLLRETVAVEVGDRAYSSLRAELLLLHLCYHFHQHRGFLKGLLDIAGWIDRFEESADLAEIRQMAARLGVWGLVQWPLHALQIFTGYRSRLYDPDVDVFVRSWAAWTAAKIERDFVEVRPASGVERWLGEQGFGAKVATTVAQGLSMMVVDGASRKVRSAVSPVVLGPHRLGRAVFGVLERAGVVDREELFVERVLG